MRFDAPDAEHEEILDAEITRNARKQRCIFFRFDFARLDPPIRSRAVEILPELLIELRLIADGIHCRHVRLHAAHHPRVGLLADAASGSFAAEERDPLLEANLRARGGQARQRGGCAGKTGQQVSSCRVGQRCRCHHDFILPPPICGCEGRDFRVKTHYFREPRCSQNRSPGRRRAKSVSAIRSSPSTNPAAIFATT